MATESDLRTDVPHTARIYDFILGGTHNYPADRAAAAQAVAGWPALPVSMRQNRLFVQRIARHLAETEGVRQFLDVGSGIPTSPNLHEVAGADAEVVYVDHDPVVIVEGNRLLAERPTPRVRYLEADMSKPDAILADVTNVFDLTRPVALSLVAVLQFVPDDVAYDVVRRLIEPLPSGSFLALSMVTADHNPSALKAMDAYAARGIFSTARSHAQIGAFFDGLELIEPGITLVHRWRPDPATPPVADNEVGMAGGVARKP